MSISSAVHSFSHILTVACRPVREHDYHVNASATWSNTSAEMPHRTLIYGTLNTAAVAAAAAVLPEAEQWKQQATQEPTTWSHRRTIDRCMLLTAARQAVNNRRSRCKADYSTGRFIAYSLPRRRDQCSGVAVCYDNLHDHGLQINRLTDSR